MKNKSFFACFTGRPREVFSVALHLAPPTSSYADIPFLVIC